MKEEKTTIEKEEQMFSTEPLSREEASIHDVVARYTRVCDQGKEFLIEALMAGRLPGFSAIVSVIVPIEHENGNPVKKGIVQMIGNPKDVYVSVLRLKDNIVEQHPILAMFDRIKSFSNMMSMMHDDDESQTETEKKEEKE